MPRRKRFLLRLDPRLFEAIRRWAEDDLRSINGQIEYLLTDQARRAGRLPHRRTRPELSRRPSRKKNNLTDAKEREPRPRSTRNACP